MTQHPRGWCGLRRGSWPLVAGSRGLGLWPGLRAVGWRGRRLRPSRVGRPRLGPRRLLLVGRCGLGALLVGLRLGPRLLAGRCGLGPWPCLQPHPDTVAAVVAVLQQGDELG